MTNLYLIRHAQTQANAERRFQGRLDLPVTEAGEKQIELLTKRMKEIPLDCVYTSPLLRARQTAEAVAAAHGLTPVVCEGVIEISGGDFENHTFVELMETNPLETEHFFKMPHLFHAPGGESYAAVYDRMKEAVLHIVGNNKGKSIAVISHGCATCCFVCYALGVFLDRIPEMGYGGHASVTHITFDDELRPEMQYRFDDSHLTLQG